MRTLTTTNNYELVVNWHITEACNYSCGYCYAKWNTDKKELIHSSNKSMLVLEQLYQFFHPSNANNPLCNTIKWNTVRLNIAGGEPLLYQKQVSQIIIEAKKMGFSVSIITNGSNLTESLVTQIMPSISILGLSIDSASNITNQKIGQIDKLKNVISINELIDVIQLSRRLNPELNLKINTVVNAMNWEDDLRFLIQLLAPQKWKVLKMLPVLTDDLTVSDAQFMAFVGRHQNIYAMCVEDNVDMSESYIMIDPSGRFYQNSLEHKGYSYSSSIVDVGVAKAFSQIMFSANKFCSRYT